MDHSINLTHDGTLILRIPKGYQVDKVVVEEMGTENRKEYQPTHETPSNVLDALDCVDRQAAIDALCSVCGVDCDKSEFVYDGKQEDQVILCPEHYVLTQLPSVQPRKGKWIGYKADDKDWQRDDGSPIFMNCSECHEAVINNGSAHWNFCPNCGADMRGEQDDKCRQV